MKLMDYMRQPNIILGGFNNKHYDNYIIQGILFGYDNEIIFDISQRLIEGYNGWELPYFENQFGKAPFNSFDLMDDMQLGLSLKAIEGHLGMSIVESDVDFMLDRSLTEEELKQTIKYCKNDVYSTYELSKLRMDYLQTKLDLGRMRNIPDELSLACTNAKLVAKYLQAKRKPWRDGRDYHVPEELNRTYVPQEVFDFFETIHDKSISDEKVFGTRLKIMLGTCPCVFAWGGVHGSETKYHEIATETRVIQNRDVSSLYPSLAIQYNYMCRNCADTSAFKITYDTRIAAKHNGDKKTAKTLKLPLNTYTGAMENQYNDLYDPLMPRSIRITGQLFICELVCHLLQDIPTFKLINLNTDGLMYSVDKQYVKQVDEICSEWEKRVRLELETDNIKEVFIKDVNNLFIIHTDGEVKKVGGYLNYGITSKGAFSINNNYVCVKKALCEYFEKRTPIEKTIHSNNNIFDFQIIAKAGSTYKEASYYVGGERQVIQKVNRCYATNNASYGTIKKRKADKNSDDKLGNLPDHVLLDNDNQLTIADVYKQWYIDKAYKMLHDYIG